ncbi:hypothetical protein KY284_026578 [Solanum tuberosum]|nr:hypothetical protein KY284_026578 [Solanum tuberosum]
METRESRCFCCLLLLLARAVGLLAVAVRCPLDGARCWWYRLAAGWSCCWSELLAAGVCRFGAAASDGGSLLVLAWLLAVAAGRRWTAAGAAAWWSSRRLRRSVGERGGVTAAG